MDPQVSGSFIPKKSLVETRSGGGSSIFLLLGIFLFALSLISAGAVFGYQHYLVSSIAGRDASLKLAEGAFEPDAINTLMRTDSRLRQTAQVLQQHVAPSALFDLLSQLTLSNIQFTAFSYDGTTSGGATVTLTGIADSFSTVALQSDAFGSSKYLRDIVFSGIAINQTGHVTFDVRATTDNTLLSYANHLNSQGITPNPAPAQNASSTQQ